MVLLALGRARRYTSRDTARIMSRLCCTPLGIRVVVHDMERIDAHRPCVFVANHQSFLDYPILGRVLPSHTVVVGKAEMRAIPVVGQLFRWTGNVFVKRRSSPTSAPTPVASSDAASADAASADAASADAMLADIVTAIRRDGASAWMFPEGTRRTRGTGLLPFKTGAFRIARLAGVPVVPVVVDELKPLTDIRGRMFARRVVNVRVLAATRAVRETDDLRELMRDTHQRMLAALD